MCIRDREIPPETVGAEPVSGGISFIVGRQLVNNSNCADFNKGILRKSCNCLLYTSVLGTDGIDYMIQATEGLPVEVLSLIHI